MSSMFHVKGLKELQTELNKLPAKIEANVMRSALREGAKVIADDARARVPVRSGRLRDSIRVSGRSRRGVVRYSVLAGGSTKKRVTAKDGGGVKVSYDNAFYARFVEFGTKAHRIGARFAKALVLRSNKRASSGFAKRWMRAGLLVEGVQHPGSQARPFMRPALDNKAVSAVEAVRQTVRKKLSSTKLSREWGTFAPPEDGDVG